jgi:hypothetical protein
MGEVQKQIGNHQSRKETRVGALPGVLNHSEWAMELQGSELEAVVELANT